MKQNKRPSICIVSNREIIPILLGLAEEYRDLGCNVSFLGADEFTCQLVKQFGFPVIKRPSQRSLIYRAEMRGFEEICKMDIKFTSLGIPLKKFWQRYFCKRANYFKNWLDRVGDQIDRDLIIVFNGVQFFERIVVNKFKEEGRKTIFIENGLFPKTAQFGKSGVNAFLEIRTIPDCDLARGVSFEAVENFVNDLRNEFSELKGEEGSNYLLKYKLNKYHAVVCFVKILFFDVPFLFFEFLSKAPFFIKRRFSFPKKNRGFSSGLPDRYVFFPLQVSADSQLLVHANDLSIEEAIFMLNKVVAKMSPSCRLVIKEHPMERNINYNNLRTRFPEICWIKGVPLDEIIQNSLCVITINSSVGLQALFYNKPVICLGNALYGRKGVAATAENIDELEKILLASKFCFSNKELIYRFLYHLYHFHSISYDRSSVTKDQLHQMAIKLIGEINE